MDVASVMEKSLPVRCLRRSENEGVTLRTFPQVLQSFLPDFSFFNDAPQGRETHVSVTPLEEGAQKPRKQGGSNVRMLASWSLLWNGVPYVLLGIGHIRGRCDYRRSDRRSSRDSGRGDSVSRGRDTCRAVRNTAGHRKQHSRKPAPGGGRLEARGPVEGQAVCRTAQRQTVRRCWRALTKCVTAGSRQPVRASLFGRGGSCSGAPTELRTRDD